MNSEHHYCDSTNDQARSSPTVGHINTRCRRAMIDGMAWSGISRHRWPSNSYSSIYDHSVFFFIRIKKRPIPLGFVNCHKRHPPRELITPPYSGSGITDDGNTTVKGRVSLEIDGIAKACAIFWNCITTLSCDLEVIKFSMQSPRMVFAFAENRHASTARPVALPIISQCWVFS